LDLQSEMEVNQAEQQLPVRVSLLIAKDIDFEITWPIKPILVT